MDSNTADSHLPKSKQGRGGGCIPPPSRQREPHVLLRGGPTDNSLQFVITDQISPLSPLISNDRSIPLKLDTMRKRSNTTLQQEHQSVSASIQRAIEPMNVLLLKKCKMAARYNERSCILPSAQSSRPLGYLCIFLCSLIFCSI